MNSAQCIADYKDRDLRLGDLAKGTALPAPLGIFGIEADTDRRMDTRTDTADVKLIGTRAFERCLAERYIRIDKILEWEKVVNDRATNDGDFKP